MPRRTIRARSIRRRLAVAFVVAVAVSAGALAAVSFVLVRQARLSDSLRRAERETRTDLVLATGLEPGDDSSAAEQFVAGFAQRRVNAILIAGDGQYPSDLSVNPTIPADVRSLVAAGDLAYRRIEYRGLPYLLVGGRPPRSQVELYVLQPEDELQRDLRALAWVLVSVWGAIVVAGALAGRAVARRTLGPVAEASHAARSIAEGLLETRLPVASEDEFGNWAHSFNEMAEALEAKIRALSEAEARERRFTADVSHELRTPLTALVGAAGLMRQHLDRMPEEARRPAELIVEDIARLRRLVDELMEISRLDAGGERVQAEEVALRSFVEALLAHRGWGREVSVAGEDLAVQTDPRRLERILDNLVANALVHGGREVSVAIRPRGSEVLIEVSDRGPGLAPDDLERVFDRFYKADPARARGGSGLGLAIARENAGLLRGSIEAWSEPGLRTCFTLRLPVAKPLHARDVLVMDADDHGAQEEKGGRT